MQQLKRGCWENTVSPTLPPGSPVALAYRVAMKISHHCKDRNWEKVGKLPPQQKLCRIAKVNLISVVFEAIQFWDAELAADYGKVLWTPFA